MFVTNQCEMKYNNSQLFIGDNYFAVFDTTGNASEHKNANYTMTSPMLNPGEYQLSFWYFLKNPASHLEMCVLMLHGSKTCIFNKTGTLPYNWEQTTQHIKETNYFQV